MCQLMPFLKKKLSPAVFCKVFLVILFISSSGLSNPYHRYTRNPWERGNHAGIPQYNTKHKPPTSQSNQSLSSRPPPTIRYNSNLIPNSRSEFCSLVTTPDYFFKRLRQTKERISFKNQGSHFSFILKPLAKMGILFTEQEDSNEEDDQESPFSFILNPLEELGIYFYNVEDIDNMDMDEVSVCWWHSRLQRAAAYLSVHLPHKEKPTHSQVEQILHALIDSERVVEIPGYSNFYDFTKENESIIQNFLNDWQFRETFLNFSWVRGLSGKSELSADQLSDRMDEIYYHVEILKRATYVKLQKGGFPAHALLILSLQPKDDGYSVKFIDSNFPGSTQSATYTYGNTQFEKGVPYIEYIQDHHNIELAINRYCDFQ